MKVQDHTHGYSEISHYREGTFFYTTDTGITFPVPVSEIKSETATLCARSTKFRKWIRREMINQGLIKEKEKKVVDTGRESNKKGNRRDLQLHPGMSSSTSSEDHPRPR